MSSIGIIFQMYQPFNFFSSLALQRLRSYLKHDRHQLRPILSMFSICLCDIPFAYLVVWWIIYFSKAGVYFVCINLQHYMQVVLETEQSQHQISTHILLMPNLKLYSAESLENMIMFSTLTLCISFQDLFCMFTFYGCWQCNLALILE